MSQRYHDFSLPLHGEHLASDMGEVSVPAERKSDTSAREATHATVAEWFADAIEGRRTQVATAIGVSSSTLKRYASGDLRVPLADVVLAPSKVALEVLYVAIDHVSEQRSPNVDTLDEVLTVILQAGELAKRLKASPLKTIPDFVLDQLISLGRETMSRLGGAVHDLVKERDERAKKRGGR